MAAGSLTLNDLTLEGGMAKGGDSNSGGLGAGGAIFNQGTLVLNSVTLVGNTAQGGSNQSASIGGGDIRGGGYPGLLAVVTLDGGLPVKVSASTSQGLFLGVVQLTTLPGGTLGVESIDAQGQVVSS